MEHVKNNKEKMSTKRQRPTYLGEAPSFPEPDVAFPLSPPLGVFPDVPLDFLAEALSFPSGPFPSNSGLIGAALGVFIQISKQDEQLESFPVVKRSIQCSYSNKDEYKT